MSVLGFRKKAKGLPQEPVSAAETNDASSAENLQKLLAQKDGLGDFRIHEQVIASIVGVVISETDGVYPMSYGFVQDMLMFFRKKRIEKGVTLEGKSGKLAVHVYVRVDYGVNIPQVIHVLQEKISARILDLTGMSVYKVHVDVSGIAYEKGPRAR